MTQKDNKKILPEVNFEVLEYWRMTCPHCDFTDEAPFNAASPMSPLKIVCKNCKEEFILTYDRELT